ncbi:hypothetical protein HK405_000403, partial [Cladochytrium tenue]
MPGSKQPVYNPDGSYNYAYSIYGSKPNTALAEATIVIFLVVTVAHLVQAVRYRTSYMIPAVLGALFEVIGYAARVLSINNPFNTNLYAVQQLFIVVAPVLVSASQYVILGEIMQSVDPRLAPVRPNLVAKIFVSSDVVSFVVQAAGAALLIVDTSYATTTSHIIVAGLAVQIASFAAFLGLAALYYIRVRRAAIAAADADGEPPSASAGLADYYPSSSSSKPRPPQYATENPAVHPRWPLLFAVLATGAAAVLLRCLYRIVSFGASLSLSEYY